jgi:beta-xylosidase
MKSKYGIFLFILLKLIELTYAEDWYKNPITTDFGCADPALLNDPVVKNRFLLACTGGRFAVRHSSNLLDWEYQGHKLVNPGNYDTWATSGRSWAPEIVRIGSHLVSYYTQNSKAKHGAIGVSWTNDLAGKSFYPARSTAIVNGDHVGGVIDPSYFKDPSTGNQYLLYKIDGNSIGVDTRIRINQLSDDGRKVVGTPQTIKTGGNRLSNLVEGQDLIKYGSYYYLFYSYGSFLDSYQVRVARSKSVYGPYSGDRIILKGSSVFKAPGHGKVLRVPGKWMYFYHAYDNRIGDGKRYPMIDEIHWKDGWPIINNGFPSSISQYAPMVPHSYFDNVTLRWNSSQLRNPKYSLDIIYAGGTKASACLNASIIKDNLSVDFDGWCKSANNFYRRPKTKMKFRVCAAENGDWSSSNRKVECTNFKNIYDKVSYTKFTN